MTTMTKMNNNDHGDDDDDDNDDNDDDDDDDDNDDNDDDDDDNNNNNDDNDDDNNDNNDEDVDDDDGKNDDDDDDDIGGVDDLPRKRFGQGGVRPPRVSSRPQRSMRSSRGRCSSWSVAGGPWGEGRKTVGIMSLFFTAASRATASKNSDCHAMLNVIQHGVTIADLRIRRKEQQ